MSEYRAAWTRNSGYYATRGMPIEAQAIIEDAQPYHRRHAFAGHPLWVLRRLSNDDKHEALHLVGAAASAIDFEVVQGSGMDVDPPAFIRGPFENGAEIARLPPPRADVPGEGEMHVRLGFAYTVAFSKTGPANGAEVGRTLTDIRNSALETIVRLIPFLEDFLLQRMTSCPTSTPGLVTAWTGVARAGVPQREAALGAPVLPAGRCRRRLIDRWMRASTELRGRAPLYQTKQVSATRCAGFGGLLAVNAMRTLRNAPESGPNGSTIVFWAHLGTPAE